MSLKVTPKITVRDLIIKLIEFPMDAEVVVRDHLTEEKLKGVDICVLEDHHSIGA